MNKIKNKIIVSCAALMLALSMQAADTNVVKATSVPSTGLFNPKEFALNIKSGYVVNTSSATFRNAFQDPYAINLQVGASYFFTKYLGAEIMAPFYSTKGASVREVQAGPLLRLPIGFVAPYIGANGVYSWNAEKEFAYIAKAGLEFRLNNKVGIPLEAQYRNENFNWKNGQTSLLLGLRVIFN